MVCYHLLPAGISDKSGVNDLRAMNRPVRWLSFFALLIVIPVTLPGKDSPIYTYRLAHLPDAQVREVLQRYNRSFDHSRALPLEDGATVLLTCYDVTGKVVFRKNTGSRYRQSTALPSGIYLLVADLPSGRNAQRVVVR